MAIPFIDLCSGIGGFHSGLVNTGHYRCVGHAEIDKNAEKAYNAIYGEEGGLNYGDLRTINPRELPHFDMLCGGFPCQMVLGGLVAFAILCCFQLHILHGRPRGNISLGINCFIPN